MILQQKVKPKQYKLCGCPQYMKYMLPGCGYQCLTCGNPRSWETPPHLQLALLHTTPAAPGQCLWPIDVSRCWIAMINDIHVRAYRYHCCCLGRNIRYSSFPNSLGHLLLPADMKHTPCFFTMARVVPHRALRREWVIIITKIHTRLMLHTVLQQFTFRWTGSPC